MCANLTGVQCVSGDRLASALAMRRPELWDINPRLAERIEMQSKMPNAHIDRRMAVAWQRHAVWQSSILN
jgi:hypothetical protein